MNSNLMQKGGLCALFYDFGLQTVIKWNVKVIYHKYSKHSKPYLVAATLDWINIQINLTETSPSLSAQMVVLNSFFKGLYYLGCITLDGVSNSYYVVLSNNLVKLHWIFLIKEGFFF
jgi:hypothetical protein